jgi:hypothetical protein
MSNRENASRARQRLLDANRRHGVLVDAAVGERGPLLKGAFHLGGTKCGKENCKCAQGELHTTAVVVVPVDGRSRTFYVRGPDRPEAERRAQGYRRLRKARAEVRKLHGEVLDALDALVEALLEPVPGREESGSAAEEPGRRGKRKKT